MSGTLRYVPGAPRYRLDLALQRELEAGERVIWQGMQIGRVSVSSFGIYLFAVPWTAFSLFWTLMASFGVSEIEQTNSVGLLAWAFPLFGLPFVAIGFGMLVMPFIPLWDRGRVLYAVTNDRVLKLRLGRKLTIKALPANRVGLVERQEGRDGKGSLKLAVSVGTDSDGDATTEHFDLGEVVDVLGAHQAIRQLRTSLAG